MSHNVIFMRNDKNIRFVFENSSKKKRARTTTAAAAEEFSQSIQVPSFTHPGTTYPVRAIPHTDIYMNVLVRVSGLRTPFPSSQSSQGLTGQLCAQNTATYCTAATRALEMAGRARSVPQERSKELFELLLCAPGRSKELLEPPLGAPGRSK